MKEIEDTGTLVEQELFNNDVLWAYYTKLDEEPYFVELDDLEDQLSNTIQ